MPKQYGEIGKHFNNKLKTLDKMLDQEMRRILEDIGEKTVNKIREFLDQYWYNTYSPIDYDRTGSLRNAVRYTIEKNKIKIYFDRRYFSTKKVNDGLGWQPHRGFDGETFINGLIDFLDDGTGNGGVRTNPRRNDGNLDIIGYAEKYINQYMNNIADKKINAMIKKYL